VEESLFYKGRRVSGFDALLKQYGRAELRSPSRSTVLLLAYWRRSFALEEFETLIGHRFPSPIELLFEHQVPVQNGRGKASHTDLLIRAKGYVVAIEAKHTEPAYDTVAAWQGSPKSENRRKVLEGWLRLINSTVGTSLTADAVQNCTYQLIHRTASACEAGAKFRAVAYQCFNCTPRKIEEYVGQLRALKELMEGGRGMNFYFFESTSNSTEQYGKLQKRWESLRPWLAESHKLAEDVRRGLRDELLLGFEPSMISAL
jgi:hypothetical protein